MIRLITSTDNALIVNMIMQIYQFQQKSEILRLTTSTINAIMIMPMSAKK
jgi:hypothetical protein